MNILLVGKNNSITNTLQEMLISVDRWKITHSSAIHRLEEKMANQTIDPLLFALVLLNMSGFSSKPVQLVNQLKHLLAPVPLLVMASYDRRSLIEPLLKAGAQGYLQNGCSDDHLIKAVQTVAAGKQYVKTEIPS